MKLNICIKYNRKSNLIKTYITCIVVLYLTDSLLFATNSNELFLYGKRFLLIFIDLIILIYYLLHKRKISIYLVIISLCVLVSSVLAGRVFNGYFYYTFIANLFFAYFITKSLSLELFSESYYKIMIIICLFSIFTWILSPIIRGFNFLPVITNTIGNRYKFLLLSVVPEKANSARRNYGIFREPGVFQFFIFIALYFYLFISKAKKNILIIGIFIIGLLSTLSGAALIPSMIVLAAFSVNEKGIRAKLITILIILIVIVLFSTNQFNEIIQKMLNEGTTNSSLFRWIGIEGGLRGFIANPLFGSSPEVNDAIKTELAYKYLDSSYASNTNTYFNILAYFGIFVGGWIWFQTYKFFRLTSNSLFAGVLCFIAFILSSSNEDLMNSLIISIIVMWGFELSRSVKNYN